MPTVQELQHQSLMMLVQRASEAQQITATDVGNRLGIQNTELARKLVAGNQWIDPDTNEPRGNQTFTPEEAQAFVDKFELIKVQTNDNYGYAATAWRDRDTGNIYVGVRSTENRVEVLNGNPTNGDYTRDSLADKQILNTGFAFGQTASHFRFMQGLSDLADGNLVYQSAYSLSGNPVGNALLAGIDLGTTSGHVGVNVAGAGSVGEGTTLDALNTYVRLRDPIALTSDELFTIRDRLAEDYGRAAEFEALRNKWGRSPITQSAMTLPYGNKIFGIARCPAELV